MPRKSEPGGHDGAASAGEQRLPPPNDRPCQRGHPVIPRARRELPGRQRWAAGPAAPFTRTTLRATNHGRRWQRLEGPDGPANVGRWFSNLEAWPPSGCPEVRQVPAGRQGRRPWHQEPTLLRTTLAPGPPTEVPLRVGRLGPNHRSKALVGRGACRRWTSPSRSH